MATNTESPTSPKTSTISSKSSDHPGVPFRATSHNYINAQAAAPENTEPHNATIHIPDGRKNSVGELLPSPTESWKPNFQRTQSWNQEDLKRLITQSELEKKRAEGQGTGFTEGGEGTRKI